MPAGSTYTPIATTTLGSTQQYITFSSLGSYTDIYAVISAKNITGGWYWVKATFNSDTGSNYSNTVIQGDGSTASSYRYSNTAAVILGATNNTNNGTITASFQNYANTTTNKTVISRSSETVNGAFAMVGLWRNTAAITSIRFDVENGTSSFASGSTITLYGIASA
jgi:hypothetical protein